MEESYVPGDVDIRSVDLEGNDYSQNMVSMMFSEHIMAPFVKAAVTLNQYSGDMLNFDGTESCNISFCTPGGSKRVYSNLLADNMTGLSIDDAQRSRNFIVSMLSKHGIINNSTPNYQKSFKNKLISEAVKGILSDGLGIQLPINIDDTRGLQGSDNQPIILTQKSPLMHIDDLRKMAVSSNDYDGFLMFSGIGSSGTEEIFFKSIYNMIQGSPVATITNKSLFEVNSELASDIMLNAIEIFPSFPGSGLKKGPSFNKGTTMFDFNKGIAEIPRKAAGTERQQVGSSTSLNPGQLSGFVNNPFNGLPGTGNVILEDSRRPSSNRAYTAAYTEALFADMMQSFVTVKVPGNSNFKLGDIVNFEMREQTENFLNKDTQFYGKNMVIGITNYIGPIGDRPRYVTYLDLVNIQTYNGAIS